MIRVAALLILISTAAFAGQPSMSPSAWDFQYSDHMPAHPHKWGTGWAFTFPSSGGGVDYLTTSSAGSLTGYRSLAVTGSISGKGVFRGTDPRDTGTAPPSMHLFIQARGDDCLCHEFGRWWSNPQSVKLQRGAFSMTVPLRPGYWSSVYGKRGDSSGRARQGFAAAVAHPARIGMTFGAGNNFGHGVVVKGGTMAMGVSSMRARR